MRIYKVMNNNINKRYKGKTNHAINFLKVIFIYIIVIHHTNLLKGTMLRGYIGVELFFITSGYFLYQTFLNHRNMSVLEYGKRRLTKLYPHYLFSFIIMALYTMTYSAADNPVKPTEFIPEILMIQNIGIFDGGINYPCWYMSVLFWGSIVIFLTLRHIPEKLFNFVSVGFTAATYTFFWIKYGQIESFRTVLIFYMPLLRGIADMLLGIIIFKLKEMIPKRFYTKYCHAFQFAEIFSLTSVIILLFANFKADFLEILLLSVLLFTVSNPSSVLNSLGNNRFIDCIGKYEYAIFLNHAVVIKIALEIFGADNEHIPFKLAVILLSVTAYSIITSKLVSFTIKNSAL